MQRSELLEPERYSGLGFMQTRRQMIETGTTMLVASIAFGGDGLFPEIPTIGEFSSVAAGIT
jgi:hypothetical protein